MKDIQEKLDSNDAVVLTAEELKTKLRNNEEVTVDDVDVVTCGTSGIMSGTAALFQFQNLENLIKQKKYISMEYLHILDLVLMNY